MIRVINTNKKTPIFVTGKVLKEKEMKIVQEKIQKEIDVKIEFDSPKALGLHEIKRAFSEEIESSETKFYRGSLRSGKKIEYEGSMVVLGDVNSGAEVIAGENIVIVGILRGMAHAGAKGNRKAMISAVSIEAPQLRIADIIKETEKEEEQERKTYAHLEENKMIIE